MKAHDYLNQIRRCEEIIKNKQEQLLDLHCRATRVTTTWGDERTQSTPRNDSRELVYIKLMEVQEEYEKQIEELDKLKREVIATIESLENPLHIKILYKRYVKYQSWNKIARDMIYSLSGIHKMRNKALQAVQKILDEREKCTL